MSGFLTSKDQQKISRKHGNDAPSYPKVYQQLNSRQKLVHQSDNYNFNFSKLLEWEYDINEFDPFEFIENIPDKDSLPENCQVKKICIPKKRLSAPKVTLVLDLDETLVHCSTVAIKKADFIFPVTFNGISYQVYVRKRPFFEFFLNEVSKLFEVVVFTASHEVYASKLLDLLDKDKKWIQHRIYRDSCVQVDGNYLKDLRVLGRNLALTCIIDNSPQAFAYQIHNGIPIYSWYEDDQDDCLLRILPFLRTLSDAQDVRPLIRQKFRFSEIIRDHLKSKHNKHRSLYQKQGF